MGWFDFLRGKRNKSESEEVSGVDFATWVDPPVSPPTEVWERRLDAYARKSAKLLSEAGVPLFSSKWSRGGRGTYRNAFWLIACDVERANRSWVANTLSGHNAHPEGPHATKQGDYTGAFFGEALLLTRSGLLCVADVEGFFVRSTGRVDDREMDMLFSNIRRPQYALRSYDWGWSNCGRWRRDAQSNITAYKVKLNTGSIRFEERNCRKGPNAEDGRDTSAALTNFVKTNGKVRWPRHFISFSYN